MLHVVPTVTVRMAPAMKLQKVEVVDFMSSSHIFKSTCEKAAKTTQYKKKNTVSFAEALLMSTILHLAIRSGSRSKTSTWGPRKIHHHF